jgi:peroxiredoxin
MPAPPAPGDAFPDLELPDHAGRPRRLSLLVGDDPTVVQTYRGFWCPKEQAWLRTFAGFQDELEVAYVNVVSVSVDPPEVASAFRAGLGARWTFLADVERRYVDELGLRETTDTVHHPYLPAVFVLDPDLTVRAVYNGYWYLGRPGMEELRADLRAVARDLRADWELTQP